MNRYRVIIEPGQAGAEHRTARGDTRPLYDPLRITKTHVSAQTLAEALQRALNDTVAPGDRIVAVEEIEPSIIIGDAELIERLGADDCLDLEDIDENFIDKKLVGSGMFGSTVVDVINALANTGIIAGLTYSLQQDESSLDPPYIMLEIFDNAAGRYISTGQDLIDLIEDRDARGTDAVISIARAIISAVNLHLR